MKVRLTSRFTITSQSVIHKMKDNQELDNSFEPEISTKCQSFGLVLKKVRKKSKMTSARFSNLAELHINSQSNYENDKRDPSIDYLIQFSRFIGVSFWQLMARRVELSKCEGDYNHVIYEQIKPFFKHFGRANEQNQNCANTPQIVDACLELMSQHQSNPNITVLEQNGDSMAPTIKEGDTLFVDTSQTKIKEGEVFVFKFSDLYSAKRVQLVPGGGVMLVSDNNNFTPVNMKSESLNEQMIVGKLVSSISHFGK